ncbi:MAG: hypothetical protein A3K03_09635 [Bdellovibrionales bacterium RIFOXYD1_FULL_44_7]|nr:MAG: hypothetical protein A3K03_09635 [Bdellovibrionales bacterium RIFOXYD1_FULL_44_7]
MEQKNLTSLLAGEELPVFSTTEQVRDLVGPFSSPKENEAEKKLLNSDLMNELAEDISSDTRRQMGRLTANALPHSAQYLPAIVTLINLIKREFEANPLRLLSLNPSRREAIAQHLNRIANLPPVPSCSYGFGDAAGGLRKWVSESRSDQENTALQTYFEEIALFVIAQALLLKGWSDKRIRSWKEEDLSHLNTSLDAALKPYIPLDRDGWQITQRNLYSWYNPSAAIQKEIWKTYESWDFSNEPSFLLMDLVKLSRQTQPNWPEYKGYDQRFFFSVWAQMQRFGFNPADDSDPIRRKKLVFSPTIRDGSILRDAPPGLTWAGLEMNPFQLFLAELMQLWQGPNSPILWAIGSGLEVFSREQLSLSLGSPKPSIYSRISEMEACDLSFVFEERSIRFANRSAEAQRLKEQLEAQTHLKKYRSPNTTLGGLQALVSSTKLRPGGLLLWAREEPLSAEDGQSLLGFVLERTKLLAEWDLSGVEHTLPSRVPLFPKYLYLFLREPNFENRVNHRPTKIVIQGQIHSHVEVALFLQDGFDSYFKQPPQRDHWEVIVQKNQQTQKELSEHWPDPICRKVLKGIGKLRSESLPLASVTTIRSAPDKAEDLPKIENGILVRTLVIEKEKRLIATPIRELNGISYGKEQKFVVVVPEASWVAPVAALMESQCIKNWLEFSAEKRGNQWILNDQLLKYLPVPKSLLKALGHGGVNVFVPNELLAPLQKLSDASQDFSVFDQFIAEEKNVDYRAATLVHAATARTALREKNAHVTAVVNKDARINWSKLFEILPPSQLIPATLHTELNISGQLQPNLPIGRIEFVGAHPKSIMLICENGANLTLKSENALLIQMLSEQLEGVVHPTWAELINHLKLPRRIEAAEAIATDVLRSHGLYERHLSKLDQLITSCSGF